MSQKLPIDASVWNSPKLPRLCSGLAWEPLYAVGFLVTFWYATRNAGLVRAPLPVLTSFFPKSNRDPEKIVRALAAATYLKDTGDAYTYGIEGNAEFIDKYAWRAAAGRKGGTKSRRGPKKAPTEIKPAKTSVASPTTKLAPRKKASNAPAPALEANRRAWEAYSSAYEERWKTTPLRNARANSMISQFVARVGKDDAPAVLRFYVGHNDSFYIRRTHDISCAVKDAESLVTQYRRGRPLTAADVRAMEVGDAIASQLARIEQGNV